MNWKVKLVEWLEQNLPSVLIALTWGYRWGKEDADKEKKSAILTQLELRKRINEARLNEKLSHLSDADILKLVLESGERDNKRPRSG